LLTVNPVNDLPTLNTISDLVINEDSGMRTVNLSGITSGASNELQTLTVTAVSSDAAIIPNPAVDYTSRARREPDVYSDDQRQRFCDHHRDGQ
jgi:hypothetical protein